ncbi:MAG: hypothetical protein P4L51_15115 [Puia sp.]|nr:hypothetical protein [Puia sp.]
MNDERHAPENCKEVGQRLIKQHIQDTGGRQTKELVKGLREGQKELGAGLLREIDRFRSSLALTGEQRKMQRLDSEGKYAELYFYAKILPAVDANNEAATEELNKRLLKVLDTAYEGLQNVRNKIAAGAGETLVQRIAGMKGELRKLTTNLQNSEKEQKRLAEVLQNSEKERERLDEVLQNSEKELKRLTEVLQNNEESLRRCLAACDAREFKEILKESTAAIDKQYEPQKKKDIITKLGDRLNAAENGFDSALDKFNAQLGTKAAEVREFRRVLDAKGEEINKHIAEEEQKKLLMMEKGECAFSQRVAEKLLAGYTGHKAYAGVKKAYEELVSNSSGDPVPRTVMLIYYYRSFAHPCGLGKIDLSFSSVDDKGATIIACGLKLSTKVTRLNLRKQTPARLY